MKENIRSIQFLRFVAAALVVAFHLTQGLEKYYEGSISAGVAYVASFGASGVHIFFVISGFVMVYTSFSQHKDSFVPSKFLIRRFIRIYPIYWVYATLYLLFHNTFQVGYSLSTEQVLRAYFLLPGDSANIIGPGWTLSFEVYFYVCFGIVMVLGLWRGLPLLTAFFLLLIGLRYVFHIDINQQNLHVFTNSLLIEFLLGAWIAYFVVTGTRIGMRASNWLVITGLIAIIAEAAFGYSRLPSVVLWGIPSALIVAGLASRELNGQLFTVMQKYSWLGDSSYSLYLLHILLIDISLVAAKHFVTQFNSVAEIWAIYSFLLVFYIAFAAISYKLIERNIVLFLQRSANARFSRLMGSRPVDEKVIPS